MNLYYLELISRTTPYDYYDANVVAAETADQARALCPKGDESGWHYDDPSAWLDATRTTCYLISREYIPPPDSSTEPHVVLSSFNAA